MKYTVLILRPDYIASEFGKDTYLAHVEAKNADHARVVAQREACVCEELEDGDPADYHVLFTTTGHLRDLTKDQS